MSLRVLYVSAEAVPGTDGGSVHTLEVARGLVRRGNSVTLVARREPGQGAEETLDGILIVRARMRLAGKTVPALALGWLLKLRPSDFDVVMARFAALGGAEGIFAGWGHLPLVLEVNSPQVSEILWRYNLQGGLLSSALEGWGERQFSKAAAVITPSARIVPAAARPRCRLVDWGCDTEAFHPAGAKGSRPTVVFSGTFRTWHGVDLLPAIARALLAQRPDVTFLCLGDGPGRAAVEAEAARLGVSGAFRFTGAVPFAEVPKHLAAAHVGIAPFHIRDYPPFAKFGFFYSPLKIFEYLACGLPVATTLCPELSKIVEEGKTGRLVEDGKAEAFAGALDDLLGRAEGMRGDCREAAVARFSWQAHAATVERILEETVGARRV